MPSWHVRQLGIFLGILCCRTACRSEACDSWWRHQMETFSALLALCAGNSPVPVNSPPQRPVTRSFDVFFHLRLNKRLSKQPRGWWFETPLWSLWRHCNAWVRRWHAMSIPRPHSRPKRMHTRTHFREKKGYFFKGRREFAKPRKGGTGSFFYIRCSCKLSTHSGIGVCIRQNSMFAFTEHRHLIHMSRPLQLDGGEENGGLMVIYTTVWW